MNISEQLPKALIVVLLVGGAGVFLNNIFNGGSANSNVNVKLPATLSQEAQAGQVVFYENCASCHGENGAGSDQGPPLIHNIYNPGHHGDESFFRAVSSGVSQHHWSFGNMPKQPQVKPTEVKKILSFVREVQRGNGIFNQEHRM